MMRAFNADHSGVRTGIALALEAAAEPCILADPEGRVLWMNRLARAQFGPDLPISIEALEGAERVPLARPVAQALNRPAPVCTRLCRSDGPAGDVFIARCLALPGGPDDRLVLFQGDRSVPPVPVPAPPKPVEAETRDLLRRSLAERESLRREAARLRVLAMTDPLTGLLNVTAFSQAVARSIEAAAAGQGAVLYLDLDNFKPVNDRFGHATGDAVLKTVAARLRSQLRPEDHVSRLGGDEFAICLVGPGPEVTQRIVRRLKAAVSAPLRPAGLSHPIDTLSVAVGAAYWPAEGIAPAALLRLADQRMYDDKFTRRPAPDRARSRAAAPEPRSA